MTSPRPSSEQAHERMLAQRRSGTRVELELRRALHTLGLRYRLHQRLLPGSTRTVDIVFPSARIAVDVRGCFWHACPEHGTSPRANAKWWSSKLARNRRRDAETVRLLQELGWSVVVVWEHDDPRGAAGKIAEMVRRSNTLAEPATVEDRTRWEPRDSGVAREDSRR
jgi:DNA mismatch endonuclease (patch repair protein)